MRKLFAAFLTFGLLSTGGSAQAQTPSDHFGQLPMVREVTISPDGNHLAAVYNSPNGPQVIVSPFGTTDATPVVLLKKDVDRIDEIFWQNDNRLLIRASYSDNIMGDRTRVSRLFTVTKDGKDLKEIRRKSLRQSVADRLAEVYSSSTILSLLPEDPDHILMQVWSERDRAFSVFKVNTAKNEFDKVVVNNLGVQSWGATPDGTIKVGYKYEWILSDGEYEVTIFYRKTNKDDFKEIYKKRLPNVGYFSIEGFSGDKMYVISDREIGRQALWLYDIPSAKYEKILYSHDTYDVKTGIMSRDETKLLGAGYFEHYAKRHYFDESAKAGSAFINATFPGFVTWAVDASADQNRIIVATQRNDMPTTYYWLDIKAKKGGPWFGEYPDLAQTPMSTSLPYSFKASDGMELHGYLTLPAGQGNKKPKLVVMPHGGPFGVRDYQYFDPWVQFIANRGYAVLQLNFRGSGGYGNNYEVAGYRQWGDRMQQDLYDAVEWVGQQDLVDTSQSCVVGLSYGGYASLTAAFQKPDMFKCFVSIAGIPDLLELADNDYKNDYLRNWVTATIGDPKNDKVRARLANASASNNLDKIKGPILLIHGTYDTRVPYSYSSNFYSKAKKMKLDVQYIELEYGTHYLDEDGNRKAAFKAIDTFLQKHL